MTTRKTKTTAKAPAKKKAAKKTAVKKAAGKKPAAKKATVKKTAKKTAKKAAPKNIKKIARKPAAKKAAKKASRKTTYQAMLKAKKMADRVREDDVYGGGSSFAAAQGHPTHYSEDHDSLHLPPARKRDKKARIDMLVGKHAHGHVAAQVRRQQARRDHRG